jgi:hypothetical protein
MRLRAYLSAALLTFLASCCFFSVRAEPACAPAMRPTAEETRVYEFLAQHAPSPPRAVLAVGNASSAAAWAACRGGESAAKLAVALVDERPPARERFNSTAGAVLRVLRGRLGPVKLGSAQLPAPSTNETSHHRLVRLRTLEKHHKTRFDWVVLDSGAVKRFQRLDELDDGKPRVLVVRFDAPPQKTERSRLLAQHPPHWVQLRAHPRFFAFVF